MKDFEQLPSSQMSASARMDELTSVVASALIRIFVSSDVKHTACQDTEPKKCSDKSIDKRDEQSSSRE